MKKILLFVIFILGIITHGNAQATAYPAQDLSQCANEIFDLTVQTPVILGNQSPAQFTVTYFLTLQDATNNINPISTPATYVSPNVQTIYARVDNSADATFATTAFQLSWEPSFNVPDVPDVAVCDSYVLLPVMGVHYTADMAGTVEVPSIITTSMTIFRHLDDFPCAVPSSFVVTIINTPIVYDLPDVVACDFYGLQPLEYGNYYDSPNGTGNLMFAGDIVTVSMTVYIYATTGNCSAETSFEIYINQSNPYYVDDSTACESYVLPVLPSGYEYHGNLTGMGYELVPVGTILTQSTPMQVVGDINSCGQITEFFVTIGNPPYATPTPLTGCDADGDGYGSFDLSERIAQIRNGINGLVVTFHETMMDAQTGIMPILSPYLNIVPSSQTVFARVENPDGGCFSIVALQLNTQVCGSITGTVRFDSDSNGCTVSDGFATNKMLRYQNNSGMHYAYTNSLGQYTFTDVYPGSVTVFLTAGAGVSANPAVQTITVAQAGNYTADFCIVPIQSVTFSDARVYLSASTAARPGFATGYNIIVRNEGNTMLDGSVTFTFDGDKLDFIAANPAEISQATNVLTFNVSGLSPSQYKIFNVAFMVKIPPFANLGDMLNFNAVMANSQTENSPENNTALYSQVVIDSYDPNDIMVQQGAFIYQENMPEELVYTVRFQNTGTADAVNVRIETVLDGLLDANTFRPIAASHGYVVERNYENRVTFRFTGINLAASGVNEPASHGYVVFAVKPSWLMQLGSIASAQADIYFDFNAPITTNTVTTEVVNLLGTGENNRQSFGMFPNPASGTINIALEGNFTMELFDIQGKKMMTGKGENQLLVDVSVLQQGMYFVKVVADNRTETRKLLVR